MPLQGAYEEEVFYCLALSFVKDVGPLSARKLLARFKRPQNIFSASIEELAGCQDIGVKRAESIKAFQNWKAVEEHLNKIKNYGITLLRYTDSLYPQSLRELDDAPLLLYCKGNMLKEDALSIAVVGARGMTDYGRKVASQISSALASAGITVVSGLARGIDTVAHVGAIRAKGRTIAVMGSGIDIVYPPENKRLYEQIASSGCIISEFPLETPPEKHNFPRRNRLISGLSLGVLVVEAAQSSGSLITAEYALQQNKEVFAVPGRIDSMLSRGTNQLIRKGARLVQSAEDIIEELLPQLKGMIKGMPSEEEPLEISDKEKAIFSRLREEPQHIDNILRDSGISAEEALSLLLNLEIKGIVRQIEGKRFCKA